MAGNAGAFTKTWAFLDFGAGVLALVSLSSAVLWGLAATDRLILHSKHRLLARASTAPPRWPACSFSRSMCG
ncbi:hypothetical protein SAZ11_06610 [Streptomyces sp. FXJ1.4098]|nr:hypothetical protein [Streptomyces sp. FXJ1.4098]